MPYTHYCNSISSLVATIFRPHLTSRRLSCGAAARWGGQYCLPPAISGRLARGATLRRRLIGSGSHDWPPHFDRSTWKAWLRLCCVVFISVHPQPRIVFQQAPRRARRVVFMLSAARGRAARPTLTSTSRRIGCGSEGRERLADYSRRWADRPHSG